MLEKIKIKVAFIIMLLLVILALVFICLQFKQEMNISSMEQGRVEVNQKEIDSKKEEIISKLDEDGLGIINSIEGQKMPMSLAFTGMIDREGMQQILNLLKQYDSKETFFIPAIKAAEDSGVVKGIKQAGHIIGNYGLLGQQKMDELTQKELIDAFARSSVILKQITGEETELIMCNTTEYNDDILKVGKASEYESIVEGTHFINYHSFTSYEMVLTYIRSLDKGTMIVVKLDEELEEGQYEPKIEDATPAIDKQPTVTQEATDVELPELTERERLINLIEWLLIAIDQVSYELPWTEEYADYYKEVRIQNAGKKADVIKEVYTTQQGLAFTFTGIKDQHILDETLKSLALMGAKGTFFVSGKEVLDYPEHITQIQQAGHEIASSGFTGKNLSQKTFAEVCEEMHKGKIILERRGISTDLFMPPYGSSSEAVEEAASAMGYNLITYSSTPIRASYQEMEAKDIIEDYYQSYIALRRGDIIYFRMDYYTDNKKVGKLIEEIYPQKIANTGYYKENKLVEGSEYSMMTVGELLEDTYTYPIATGAPVIYTGHLKPESKWETVQAKYIGNPYMQSAESLRGFTEYQVQQLNTSGRIDTGEENIVFFTFDDWGSDAAINRLLYVLKKHAVPATFFVRSNFVGYNPNLLRAIAEEGHDVASHTLTHYPIDISSNKIEELQDDLIQSYRELEDIIGDLEELKLLFRPPTLAVSRYGMETVLDCGFSYVINGNFSTHDYEAKSVEELIERFEKGILSDQKLETLQPGSIIVMHMSDESQYTAEALDLFFTENSQKSDQDPTKYIFAKLSDYLQ